MPSWCLLLLLFAAAPVLADERIFDIVPPEGREVDMVDGYTVLRQPGDKFGAVLTFMPESATSAWIPVAVLNTSGAPLRVGTKGVSARQGDVPLKVWATTALVRLAREGRISAPAAMAESGASAGRPLPPAADGPAAPAVPDTIGPVQPASNSQTTARDSTNARRSNAQQRQHELAVAQVKALRERLFRDETIEPRAVARGDVRIDLPPRREDGQPAEFVLSLEFGGERMDVRYRERVPAP